MRKHLSLIFFIFFLFLFNGKELNARVLAAESLSDQSTASILTSGVGDEVYVKFGHTAIRISDPQNGLDLVYNFGMFEFDDEIIIKFINRDLRYYMGVSDYPNYVYAYMQEQRDLREQVLNIPPQKVRKLYAYLMDVYEDESKRYYLYDFFLDNCATRPALALETVLGSDLKWYQHPKANKHSYREFVSHGFRNDPWTNFGIDLLLGTPIDQKMDNTDLMFHPFYLEEIIAKSTYMGKPLAQKSKLILKGREREEYKGWFTPSVVFWTLLVIVIILSVLEFQRTLKVFDITYLLVLGLLGVMLLYMWFGTAHVQAKWNYNLLWATPIHLFTAVLLFKQKWMEKYYLFFRYAAVFFLIYIVASPILPQGLNPAFRPMIILLVFRYYYMYRNTGKIGQ